MSKDKLLHIANGMGFRELSEAIEGLIELRENKRVEGKEALIAKMKAEAEEYGLDIADLTKKREKAAPVVGERRKTFGTKLEAKFKDPATGQTWAARGRKPKWLEEYLAQGRKLEEFAA